MLPNCILMPYSFLSVVQQFQLEAFDNAMSNFYTEDYYKIDGQTQMHKFMYNPVLLEKILDDYWHQKRIYATSVLVKQQIGARVTQTQKNTHALQKNLG